MHDVSVPHCSSCEHFEVCFRTDMVTEWGYCRIKVEDEVTLKQEMEIIKSEVETGDYRRLLARSKELGLFVPTFTDCEQFSDFYPF